MIKPSLINIVLGTIFIFILIICIKRAISFLEPFEDDESDKQNVKLSDDGHKSVREAHKALPPIDPKEMKRIVGSITESIKNVIDERPEFVIALRDILKDPQIHKTLMNVVFDTDENKSSFNVANYL